MAEVVRSGMCAMMIAAETMVRLWGCNCSTWLMGQGPAEVTLSFPMPREAGFDRALPVRLLQLLLASAVFSLGPLVAPAFARGRKDKQQEKQAEKAANGRGFLGGLWSITGIVSEKDANPHKLSSAEIDAFVESMAAMWKPILSNVGISGAVGACAAAALKVRPEACLAKSTACKACRAWKAIAYRHVRSTRGPGMASKGSKDSHLHR